MGTTLTNGVYLPNEGERNCYAGLKTNWEILDQKVADVTALQQAVAGALHREIVESLPTTDIDPNTIYMVLSGTSATENVYNEFMYVNNAWELIGTSATDLTNYYTKAEVDGKLLLKANASDLTSHTGDTTIHVTASDKVKWNNQTYVLRYSSTTLVASSTNSNSLLDNTDNLKVGDKVIDASGVIYSVTAIDTANSTFTIGTSLIDLAQDSDVVHKSGNETVGGQKTFDSNTYVYNSDNTATTPNLILKNSKSSKGSTSETGAQLFKFFDKNNATLSEIESIVTTNGASELRLSSNTLDSNNQNVKTGVTLITNTNGAKRFCPTGDGDVSCGYSTLKWSSVYATNYYYGSNNVEFSTKFVTTDTAQTVSGSKTFSDLQIISYGTQYKGARNAYILPDFAAGYSGLSIATLGYSQTLKIGNFVLDANNKPSLDGSKGYVQFAVGENNNVNTCILEPKNITASSLGTSVNKWSTINGVEPSALGMPNFANGIDISSYITHLDKVVNNYTPPANGWLSIRVKKTSLVHASLMIYQTGGLLSSCETDEFNISGTNLPVIANQNVEIYIIADALASAKFYPCQGNV